MKILNASDIAEVLEGRDYYATVAWDFIIEAVEQALSDMGIVAREEDIDDIDKYIREELI